MASVLVAAVPFNGHVTPLLAVARYLAGRGDRVRFITGSRFAGAVRATGAEFIPLTGIADIDDRQDWNAVFPERARLGGVRAIAYDVESFFVRPGGQQYGIVMAAHASAPADVLLADMAFAGASYVLGHPPALRPPVVACGVVPLMLRSRDTAPYGMGLAPMPGLAGRLRNAVLYRLADRTVFPGVTRAANSINRELHGQDLDYSVLDWARRAEAIVQFSVPEFEYPRSDAPANLHFVGPVSAAGSPAPLPPWWPELGGGRPVVHVTQGTFANKDYRQVIVPALEALAEAEVLVVVSTGGRPLDTLPPLPPNARAAEFLPYDELLPQTDVFVTNGGYGGVQYALKHGVPIVTTGGQEDKPEVAARVAYSGVGRRIDSERPGADAVGRAVRAVLADPRYRRAAQRVAASMAAAGGLPALAGIVDGLTGRP